MMENIPMIAAGAGLLGLVIAFVLYQQVNKVKIDNQTVADITQEIQDGAMAFLFAEYKVLSIFVVIVGAALAFINDVDKLAWLTLILSGPDILIAYVNGRRCTPKMPKDLYPTFLKSCFKSFLKSFLKSLLKSC